MAKRRKKKGLGDQVEDIAKKTGVKKVVELFSDATGLDCGCEERKQKLNEMFPRTPDCLNKDEYEFLKEHLDFNKETQKLGKQIKGVVKVRIEEIYNRVFGYRNWKFGSCPTCAGRNKKALTHLTELMETYE